MVLFVGLRFSPFDLRNKLQVSAAVLFGFAVNRMFRSCSFFIKRICLKGTAYKKNCYWIVHQCNGAWYGSQVVEVWAVTTVFYLRRWSKLKGQHCLSTVSVWELHLVFKICVLELGIFRLLDIMINWSINLHQLETVSTCRHWSRINRSDGKTRKKT